MFLAHFGHLYTKSFIYFSSLFLPHVYQELAIIITKMLSQPNERFANQSQASKATSSNTSKTASFRISSPISPNVARLLRDPCIIIAAVYRWKEKTLINQF